MPGAPASGTCSLWFTNASFSIIRRTAGLRCDNPRSATERAAAAAGLLSAMFRKIMALAPWISSEAARCPRS